MAAPISVQQLKDASEDATTLSDFINKPENVMIPRRLATDINSLQYYLEYMKSYAQKSYETYSEMLANASNLSENVSVFVTNDLDTANNGIYTYNGTSFVKGEYQPENAAKEFVEAKLGGLEVFNGKVRAQDVSTVDGSTQDAKNTEFRNELDALPEFVGGKLADTLVTVTTHGWGTVARTQRDKNKDNITVKDFGAKGDGVTDDSDAFQNYVDWAIANKSQYIFVPFGNSEKYRLTRTINIDCSGFMIDGNRRPAYDLNAGGGYIFADDTVTDLFNYGVGQSKPTNQLNVNGVAFLGSAAKNQNAIKTNANNNGPHRGFIFSNMSAGGFDNVIYITSTTAGYIAAGSVVISNGCVFRNNNNMINATSRVFNMLVQGVQAEQGARIKGFIDGGISIKDNMLEGQSNTIDISSNSPNVVLENNYIEAATGDFFARIKGTNPEAIFEERSNFISTITAVDFYLLSGTLRINQDFNYHSRFDNRATLYTLHNTFVVAGSRMLGTIMVKPENDPDGSRAGFVGYFDPKSLLAKPSSAVTNRFLGSDVIETPLGRTSTGLLATGSTQYTTLSKSYAAGDIIVVTAYVKLDTSFSPRMEVYTDAYTEIGSVADATLRKTELASWYVMTLVRVAPAAGEAIKVRFSNGVNVMKVAAVGGDVIPSAKFQTFSTKQRAEVQVFNPFISDHENLITETRSLNLLNLEAGEVRTYTSKPTGAAIGDIVQVAIDKPLQGTTIWAEVTSTNIVKVTHSNPTNSSGAINIGEVNLKTLVIK